MILPDGVQIFLFLKPGPFIWLVLRGARVSGTKANIVALALASDGSSRKKNGSYVSANFFLFFSLLGPIFNQKGAFVC